MGRTHHRKRRPGTYGQTIRQSDKHTSIAEDGGAENEKLQATLVSWSRAFHDYTSVPDNPTEILHIPYIRRAWHHCRRCTKAKLCHSTASAGTWKDGGLIGIPANPNLMIGAPLGITAMGRLNTANEGGNEGCRWSFGICREKVHEIDSDTWRSWSDRPQHGCWA